MQDDAKKKKKKRERERKKTEKERGMRPGRKVIKGGQKSDGSSAWGPWSHGIFPKKRSINSMRHWEIADENETKKMVVGSTD